MTRDTITSLIQWTVERTPDAEALVEVSTGRRLTYAQMWHGAARVAGGLSAAGIEQGQRVAIRLPNGIPWVLAYLGTTMHRAVPVPINARLTDTEVDYIVSDASASLVIDDPGSIPDGPAQTPINEVDPESLAALFYTSGTTGKPKGAMLSHRALVSACFQCRAAIGLDPWEPTRNLIAAPLFHILATGMQLIPTFAGGGTAVVMPAFEVGSWLRTIRAERIDQLNAVPAMYWQALRDKEFGKYDASAIRFVSYGAAPTPPSLVRALMEAFPSARLSPGYGLTEAPCVTGLAAVDVLDHADSVGTALVDTELSLLGPESDNGIGQLLVHGPQVFSGYWQNPEATANALVDGWLHTGDLARVDSEGRVHLLDRRTDMINRGGENVYSIEVEGAVATYPPVAEVAVVGVPDEMMGHKVGAVAVSRAGEEIDVDALIDCVAAILADYKVPQYVVVRGDPLPRNSGGKIDKSALRRTVKWGTSVARIPRSRPVG